MSNLNRLQMLLEFCKSEPENPFNWYALALEYNAMKDHKAGELFDKLLEEFSDYLPTYYTAAQYYAEMEYLEKATKIFSQGIDLAIAQNESKTLQELRSAFEMFKFENDLD